PNRGQVGNIGATLTKVFGANWYTRTDLYFGVIGNLNSESASGIFGMPPVDGDPSRTFYIGAATALPGQGALVPAGTHVSGSLGSAGTKLAGMEDMLLGANATPALEAEADKSAILDQTAKPVEWNNSWSIWNPSIGQGLGPAFDIFNGGIQQNFGKTTDATYLDIQRILTTNTGANPQGVEGGGTYESTVAITRTGAIFVQNTAIVSAPEIDLQQPAGSSLIDNSGKRSFGSIEVGKSSATFTYVIANRGTGELKSLGILKSGTHAADFIVTPPLATSLAPGATTTFTVIFKPGAAGTRAAQLRVSSNDADENPFEINLEGTATASKPEIDVFQPSTSPLVDGRTRKSFGTVKLKRSSITKSFLIRNTGGANLLNLSVAKAGPHLKDFVITQPLKKSLPPGGSTTFTVVFKPTVKGTRNAFIRIRSNDANENPFDISVTGLGAR
ncbi:MAG: choice-of-anchor D domain-containing protein, partial [Akkermansiaceae bacterium]|nr:choice-of-anchor D domain-containing protein [Akkermansiaceae bacterium]